MTTLLTWFIRNGVATNLLMIGLLFAGLMGALNITQKVFPEFSLDRIEVRVLYPGASPDEVESSIVQPIEERIGGIEGVKEVRGIAAEGLGMVVVELSRGQPLRTRLEEIKAEIDRITTFPVEAEPAEVRELTNISRVIEVVVHGDTDEASLREMAYQIKDDLVLSRDISYVQVTGVRDYEVAIEFSSERLREHGLSLTEVADYVRAASRELPAGRVITTDGEVVVRTLGRNFDRRDFERLVLLADADGTQIRLGDIANVRDGFRDQELITRYNGKPAAMIEVYRIGDEQVPRVVEAVERYIDEELLPRLPEGFSVRIWRNDAEELEKRVNLLLKNGALGLTLVFILLALFLELRLSLRIAGSIAITFIGSFAVMHFFGMSINQMSLFGFILAIGIVVDAAIVTGENVFATAENGQMGRRGTIVATTRIAKPVIFAVATTIAAFLPLMFISGALGNFMGDIPAVVVIVMSMSLVTALLILPRHLSVVDWRAKNRIPGYRQIEHTRHRIAQHMQTFIDGPLTRALKFSVHAPGITIAGAVASVILALGLIANGHVRVSFFPFIESRYVVADIELEEGTPRAQTLAIAQEISDIAWQVGEELKQKHGMKRVPVDGSLLSVGRSLGQSGPTGMAFSLEEGHKASVVTELNQPADRPFTGTDFENLWRARSGDIPEARVLRFSARMVDLGEPVQIELYSRDPEVMNSAVETVKEQLRLVQGVLDVRDDQDRGKRELQLRLKDSGRNLGFTVTSLAQQARAALFGDEAVRVQRGRDEVRVYVRLQEDERKDLGLLERYRIKSPGGDLVPLGEIAELGWGQTPSTLLRRDGRRVVTVTASVDLAVTTGQEVSDLMLRDVLPGLAADLPGLSYDLGGEQREMEAIGSEMAQNFSLALFAIFVLLAIPFRSYVQPLVVMAAIPFGLVGAVLGHLLLGLDITLLSLFGVVGLAGVIINGSLVMLDFINEEYEKGKPWHDAIIEGAKSRFRPILLTAMTTFLGVFPLILERSIQAQFLIPLAVSIGFGVLVGTAILMLVVPALAMLPGVRPRESAEDSDSEQRAVG